MCVTAVSPSLVCAGGSTCLSAEQMAATWRALKASMLRQAPKACFKLIFVTSQLLVKHC